MEKNIAWYNVLFVLTMFLIMQAILFMHEEGIHFLKLKLAGIAAEGVVTPFCPSLYLFGNCFQLWWSDL